MEATHTVIDDGFTQLGPIDAELQAEIDADYFLGEDAAAGSDASLGQTETKVGSASRDFMKSAIAGVLSTKRS